MTRSGYGPCDEDEADEWHRRLKDTIASPEGQAFLRELADALDALPDKVLIARELIDEDGDCCALGALCMARGIDPTGMDSDSDCVAERLGVPLPLAHARCRPATARCSSAARAAAGALVVWVVDRVFRRLE